MATTKWLTVARCTELAPGEMQRVEIGRRAIALANVEGQFFAFYDLCPHQNFPLSEGILEGCRISCALHGWSFDLSDGHPYPPLLRPYLKIYPLRLENGTIQISLD